MILLDKWLWGHRAEVKACSYLQQQGLQLLAKNFRSRFGEIDLIMRHQEEIVFVEVRYRHSLAYGTPIETVSLAKQKRLWRTACCYLQLHPCVQQFNYRFDIIGMGSSAALEWVINAFEVVNY